MLRQFQKYSSSQYYPNILINSFQTLQVFHKNHELLKANRSEPSRGGWEHNRWWSCRAVLQYFLMILAVSCDHLTPRLSHPSYFSIFYFYMYCWLVIVCWSRRIGVKYATVTSQSGLLFRAKCAIRCSWLISLMRNSSHQHSVLPKPKTQRKTE